MKVIYLSEVRLHLVIGFYTGRSALCLCPATHFHLLALLLTEATLRRTFQRNTNQPQPNLQANSLQRRQSTRNMVVLYRHRMSGLLRLTCEQQARKRGTLGPAPMDRERPRGVWFRYGIKRKARRQGGRERHRFIGLSAAAAREHIIAMLPRSERKGRPQPRQAAPIKARGDERVPFLMYGWRRRSCLRERRERYAAL
ncbi:hypothetical protein MRX96_012988 [Rhipicephalus microplus]